MDNERFTGQIRYNRAEKTVYLVCYHEFLAWWRIRVLDTVAHAGMGLPITHRTLPEICQDRLVFCSEEWTKQ